MSYLKISFAFLIPILLFSASSLLMKPSQDTATKTAVSDATSAIFETPVVKDDDGPACKCFYEVNITSGNPASSAFRVRASGTGGWTDYAHTTLHYFGEFTVSAPYNYDFAVKTGVVCSGNVQVACCNRPTVSYSGSLTSVIVASNYNTGGCNTTCYPPF